ncbi:MAG: hypothetical protein H7A40_05690 [Chlamydiales bacterium]|nr:hypothetical protein [Chlamydiales bacterium]
MAQDEFDRLMEFFKLTPKERADRFEEVFANSADFFEKLNYILKNGSPEERKKMIEELQQLQSVVQEETHKLVESTGLSEEELKSFAEDPSNFTPEHWEMIQNARHSIQTDASEASKMLNFRPESPKPPSGEPKKKPKGPGKSGWVKS